jgi:hypothetical protein
MKTIGWILVALALNASIPGVAGASENYNSRDYKWIGDYAVHRDDNNFDSQAPWNDEFLPCTWDDPIRIFSAQQLYWPSCSISGDTIVVANETGCVGEDIRISRSFDRGQTWIEFPSPPCPDCDIPRVYHRDTELWLIAQRSRRLIWLKSDDLGGSWNIIDTLIHDNSSQGYCFAGTTDNLYLLYYLSNNEKQLMLTHWIDSTQNWAEPQEILRLTRWTPQPIYFDALDDTLFILCNDVATEHYEEQFFIKSTDCGLTWSEQLFLSDVDTEHSQRGAMAIDGQRIFVTWYDYKYGSHGGFHGDILGRLSIDGGENWGGEIRLTYNQMADVFSPVVYGNRLNVMWHDLRYRNYPDHMNEISHSFSYDDGVTWSPVELITPDPGAAYYPTARPDRRTGGIHIFYKEYINDADHMYYMYGSDFTGIEEEEPPSLPESPAILTNYPNPFNASTMIRYRLAIDADVKLGIYNLLGEKVATLVDRQHAPGSYSVTWDASAFTSGIYFAKLTTGSETFTKKMVLMK